MPRSTEGVSGLGGHSAHVPFFKSSLDPKENLHVVFLRRFSGKERAQIINDLENVDEQLTKQLDIAPKRPRQLKLARRWIRDHEALPGTMLAIAAAAAHHHRPDTQSHKSFIFVDSSWEDGVVLASHLDETLDGETSLTTFRVPKGIARSLLDWCDESSEHRLDEVLSEEKLVDLKMDIKKISSEPMPASNNDDDDDAVDLPDFLPGDLRLSESEPIIISLRHLDEETIQALSQSLGGDKADTNPSVKIYNWEGAEEASRLDMLQMYTRMRQNSSDDSRDVYTFFVDNILQGSEGEPQILAVKQKISRAFSGFGMIPIRTDAFWSFWKQMLSNEESADEKARKDYGEIWQQEQVSDTRKPICFSENSILRGVPVFFLRPFTLAEQRTIRSRLSTLDDVEYGQDWGNDYEYFGYLWNDDGKQERSMSDLRDLFERCDRFSPRFDSTSGSTTRPLDLVDYPPNFIAVDSQVLNDDEPLVWIGSTLDFHGADTADDLGWLVGTVAAKEAHITWVNLDIANTGPEENYDAKKLWLSDLKEYRRIEWPKENPQAEDEEEDEEEEDEEEPPKKQQKMDE